MTTTLTSKSKIISVLDDLGLYSGELDTVRCGCPIHGGRGYNFTISCNTGKWACWSHHCENEYGDDIIGLYAGVKECSRSEAERKLKITKERYVVRGSDNARPSKAVKFIDPAVISNINYKSEYFEYRGFHPRTIQYFKAFDCRNPNKSLYNRAVVPVFDDEGRLLGFSGRTIIDSECKWKHAPKGFSISQCLYNLNNAKHFIHKGTLIIIEGPLDVWRLHESGVKNSVALMGTKISKSQTDLLKKYNIKNIILILDSDPAGGRGIFQKNGILNSLSQDFTVYSLRHVLPDDVGDTNVTDVKKILVPEINKLYEVISI